MLRARLIIALFTVLLAAGAAHGQQISAPEHDVKAAFVLQFVHYIRWPTETTDPVICVIDDSRMERSLRRLVEQKGSNLRVVNIDKPPADHLTLKPCAMVFFGKDHSYSSEGLSVMLRDLPVVLVTEEDPSGDINLVIVDGRVRFQIKPERLKRAGVSISSRLLNLGLRP